MIAINILRGAGDESHSIASMWYVAFALAILVYAIVGGLVVYGALRKPKASTTTDPHDDDIAHVAPVERPEGDTLGFTGESKVLWIGGIIGPAIILAVLAVLTVTTTGSLRNRGASATTVEITGEQWWWDVDYPAANYRTANEIHLPVNEPADLVITGGDVVHSFWAPDLAGKLDAIPGQVNHLRFTPTRIGTFEGACAEFCGLQHAHMGFLVIVQSRADFDRWLARATRPPAAPTEDAAIRGAALFQRLSCAGCHTVRGTSATGEFGPDLSDFGQRRTIGALVADNTPANLGRWIVDAPHMKPGVKMPPVPLSNSQRDDIVAYLESLK